MSENNNNNNVDIDDDAYFNSLTKKKEDLKNTIEKQKREREIEKQKREREIEKQKREIEKQKREREIEEQNKKATQYEKNKQNEENRVRKNKNRISKNEFSIHLLKSKINRECQYRNEDVKNILSSDKPQHIKRIDLNKLLQTCKNNNDLRTEIIDEEEDTEEKK